MIGVIEPGAQAACEASASGRIAVLATEGTVKGGAYQRAILALRPGAHVTQVAAQIFVALAEEGWSEGEAVDAVTERYLAHLDARVDTVVLGCTHFPLLVRRDRQAAGAHAPRGGLGGDHGARHGGASSRRAILRRSARAPAMCACWPPTAPSDSRASAHDFLGSSIAERAVEAIDL